MWRVRLLDGRFSDMVNLNRAKDAAGLIVLSVLNRPTIPKRSVGSAMTARGTGTSSYMMGVLR
jgi:hypothetical protein